MIIIDTIYAVTGRKGIPLQSLIGSYNITIDTMVLRIKRTPNLDGRRQQGKELSVGCSAVADN